MEKSGLEFLDRVKVGYRKIAKNDKDRYILIDCINKSIKGINNQIIEIINRHYGIN